MRQYIELCDIMIFKSCGCGSHKQLRMQPHICNLQTHICHKQPHICHHKQPLHSSHRNLPSCNESSKAGGGEDGPFVELGEDRPFVELVQRPFVELVQRP